jgi:CheY-like chemotaxis protein
MTATRITTKTLREILIIEDNEDHLMLTLDALQDAGVVNPIRTANSLGEARSHLEEWAQRPEGERPCAILLDVRLPDGSGIDLLREIREHPQLRYIPVVMLTSSDNTPDIQNAYQNGANSYLVKPICFEEFHRKVGEAGLYWALLNESIGPQSVVWQGDGKGSVTHG